MTVADAPQIRAVDVERSVVVAVDGCDAAHSFGVVGFTERSIGASWRVDFDWNGVRTRAIADAAARQC
jgi:hypothetical protein